MSHLKKSTLLASLCWLSTSFMTPAVLANESPWPTFQQNAQRTGAVQRPAITNPKVRWQQPVSTTGWLNNPIVAEGMVFTGSSGHAWNTPDSTDGVYAFDTQTGKKRWFQAIENDVNQIAYGEGLIFGSDGDNNVWALDAKTGQRRWSTQLDGEVYQLLHLKANGHSQLIAGDSTGKLLWLDSSTGKTLGISKLDGAIRSGASASGEHVFVTTTQGSIYAFDLQRNLRWQASLRTFFSELTEEYMPNLEIYGAPTLYKDLLIVGFARDTTYSTPALVALEQRTGKLRWRGNGGTRTDWGNIRTSPAVAGNRLIYAEPYGNEIVSVLADSGVFEGALTAGAKMFPQWSSPAVAGTTAYVPRFDGGLYALNTDNGELRWQLYLGMPGRVSPKLPDALFADQYGSWRPEVGDAIYSSPALDEAGNLYLSVAGYLYCIENAR